MAPTKSFLECLMIALEDFTLRVLICAATLSIFISFFSADATDNLLEGSAIMVAVAICALVASSNDYEKE
jgi:hypothetical protein